MPNILKNDAVLLLKDKETLGSWPLGRIVEMQTGTDGLLRIVTVKTKYSISIRSVTKVAPLLLYQE